MYTVEENITNLIILSIIYLMHCHPESGVLFTGYHDDGVAPRYGSCHQRHKGQQRVAVGTGDGDDPHRFVQLEHSTVERGLLHRTSVFVAVGSPHEQPADACSYFRLGRA